MLKACLKGIAATIVFFVVTYMIFLFVSSLSIIGMIAVLLVTLSIIFAIFTWMFSLERNGKNE